MKNIAVALFFAAMSVTALAADSIKVDLTVMKGEQVATKSSVTTQDGIAAPISVMNTTSYRSKVVRTADGTLELTPGEVSTGFMATVVPSLQANGQIRLQLTLSISDLLSMDRATTDGGLEIDIPQTSAHAITQDIVLDQAQPMMFQFGGNGYQVIVTTSKI